MSPTSLSSRETSAPAVVSDVPRVLTVNPFEEDRRSIRQISDRERWQLCVSQTYREAIGELCLTRMPVVLCECHLPDGNWKDMLSQMAPMVDRPRLIVSSRQADERLWTEVLNMGGFDVLATPFDEHEVVRVVAAAWLHWKRECEHQSALGGWA